MPPHRTFPKLFSTVPGDEDWTARISVVEERGFATAIGGHEIGLGIAVEFLSRYVSTQSNLGLTWATNTL